LISDITQGGIRRTAANIMIYQRQNDGAACQVWEGNDQETLQQSFHPGSHYAELKTMLQALRES
jgi:hypothetical protein